MKIDETHDWYTPTDFIESVEKCPLLVYADTDSSYQIYNLPFDKFEDIFQLVEYVQKLANELRSIYNNALNHYGQFANLNETYNTMDFKSEVIAYKGFFNTKKFYSLSKCWDEGTFFETKPKLKITGGQIKKSDVTKLTKELLTEVYDILVMDLKMTDIYEMYRLIFVVLKNKYKLKIQEDLKSMNFNSFSIPKKWGNTEKQVPPPVIGAMLYNALMGDTFRPSDSFLVVKINIDLSELINHFENNKMNKDQYSLQLKEVTTLREKINVISIPPIMLKEESDKLLVILKQLNIKLNIEDIMLTNIDTKLDVFDKLFTDEVRMRVL